MVKTIDKGSFVNVFCDVVTKFCMLLLVVTDTYYSITYLIQYTALYRPGWWYKTCNMAVWHFPFFFHITMHDREETLWNVLWGIFHRHGLWRCWFLPAFPAMDCKSLIFLQEHNRGAKEFSIDRWNLLNQLYQTWVSSGMKREYVNKWCPVIQAGFIRSFNEPGKQFSISSSNPSSLTYFFHFR